MGWWLGWAAWLWVGIEGRAQIIAPLQVGGIVAIDAIEAIVAIVGIFGGGFGGGGAGGGWLLLFFRGWLFLLLWIRVRLIGCVRLVGCILLILWGFGVLFLVR